jgi:integrase/recombinase XerD
MDSAKGADSMLSVYSRHYPPCPSDDINYKRCRCPKWINGILGSDGPFIRRSAKTRSWEKAEDFKRKLEEEYEAKQRGLEDASRPKPALVTVQEAVSRFLNSKRNENLADSILDKLTTIFEKQFLAWATCHDSYTSLRSRLPTSKVFVTLGLMARSRRKRNRNG